MRSAKSLRRRHPADARCAPLRWNRSPDAFGGGAPAALPCLPPAGDFSPRKSPQNAPGAAAPGPPLGCAACIPRRGIAQAATLHQVVPPHTAHPFPASRGPVESDAVTATRVSTKAAPTAPEQEAEVAHGSFFAQSPRPRRRGGYQPPAWLNRLRACAERIGAHLRRRGAHCASVPRQRPLVEGMVAA